MAAGPFSGAPRRCKTILTGETTFSSTEYFHGDNGAGVGASHQTGWTGCIARIIQADGLLTNEVLTGAHTEDSVFRSGTAALHAEELATAVEK